MRFTTDEENSIWARSQLTQAIARGPGRDRCDTLFELQKRYSESHRYYHDWNHVLSVLSWVNYVYDHCVDGHQGCTHLEMSLAALFHDAVYDAAKGSPANEVASIDLLRSFKIESATDKVEEIILATASHGKTAPSTIPGYVGLFLDCDIASFSELRWEIFLATDDSIVREYELHYAKEQVAEGRKKFLSGMVADDRRIFMSEHFTCMYESIAKANIRRLIEHKYGSTAGGTHA